MVKVKDSQIIYLAVEAVVPLKAVLTLLVVLVHLQLQAAMEQLLQFLVHQQHLLAVALAAILQTPVKAAVVVVDLAAVALKVKQVLQTQAVDLVAEDQVVLQEVDLADLEL